MEDVEYKEENLSVFEFDIASNFEFKTHLKKEGDLTHDDQL